MPQKGSTEAKSDANPPKLKGSDGQGTRDKKERKEKTEVKPQSDEYEVDQNLKNEKNAIEADMAKKGSDSTANGLKRKKDKNEGKEKEDKNENIEKKKKKEKKEKKAKEKEKKNESENDDKKTEIRETKKENDKDLDKDKDKKEESGNKKKKEKGKTFVTSVVDNNGIHVVRSKVDNYSSPQF